MIKQKLTKSQIDKDGTRFFIKKNVRKLNSGRFWSVSCFKGLPAKLLICAQLFETASFGRCWRLRLDAVGRVLRQAEPAGQIHPFDPVGLSLAP